MGTHAGAGAAPRDWGCGEPVPEQRKSRAEEMHEEKGAGEKRERKQEQETIMY